MAPGGVEIISQRRDVVFYLLTKRPERVEKCLPVNWGRGWENVFFNVTCENQAPRGRAHPDFAQPAVSAQGHYDRAADRPGRY